MKKCVETKLENSENSTDTETVEEAEENKTCGFCKVFCGNDHCITKEKK